MKSIPEVLEELIKEGYKKMGNISKNLIVYYKGKERIFYDTENEKILRQYQSDKPKDYKD